MKKFKKQHVVRPKNLLSFKIWLQMLGYTVTAMADGKGFNFRFKKQYGYVTAGNTGNSLALQLGAEFEEHLTA